MKAQFWTMSFSGRGDTTGEWDAARLDALDSAEPVGRWDPPLLHAPYEVLDDYLADTCGLRLCSARLRAAMESALRPDHSVEWLPAEVVDAAGARHAYHVLHALMRPDVLDPSSTIRVGPDFVVRPVIRSAAAAGFRLFDYPGAGTRLIVSRRVVDAVRLAACTGARFATVKCT